MFIDRFCLNCFLMKSSRDKPQGMKLRLSSFFFYKKLREIKPEDIKSSLFLKKSFKLEILKNITINRFCLILLFSFFYFSSWAKNPNPFPLNKALIKKIKKQGSSLISERMGEYILRAENLASNKKYNKAIELLQYHYDKAEKTEKAIFAVQIAYLYKQMDNNKKALEYFKTALDSKNLDYNRYLSALYYKAQIYIEEEKYNKALDLLKLWFSINENPNPSSYVLLAHCYYAKNNIKLALKYVEITLSLTTTPKESWLSFAVGLYLKEKNYKKAQPYLERLVALYPATASHWKQLAGVYMYSNQAKKAFITLDMAYKMGHLNSKTEYLNLVSLYIDQGLPYQGAQLLQKKLQQNLVPEEQKNLELIAGAFYLAREGKQSLAYLKKAAKTATDSKFFLNYGQRLLEQEEWKSAEKIFKKALQTEDIKKTIKNIADYKKDLLSNQANPFLKNNTYSTELFIENQKESKEDQNKNKDLKSDTEKTKQDSKLDTKNTNKDSKIDKEKQDKAPPTNYLEHIYLGIGVALYNQQKYEEALAYFKKAIEVKDTFLSAYQWIDYTETSMQEQNKKQELEKSKKI